MSDLIATDSGGQPLRFADHFEFGAQANGESWGRWPNAQGDPYPMLATFARPGQSGAPSRTAGDQRDHAQSPRSRWARHGRGCQ